jgi:predicted Na+-dependent transporter
MGVSILVVMVSILLLVGLQVTLSELKAMDIRAVGTVLVFTYVVGPIIGLLLSVTLRLRRSWAVAILVWCSTPQMSRTSVSTAVVGGNVSLALTATLVSMAASMVATPVVLELSVLVFNALSDGGGADGQNVEVDLPVLKILAALCILLAVAGFGVFANEKLAAGTIEALKKVVKMTLLVAAVFAIVLFWLCPASIRSGFFSATFYSGDDAGKFWAAATLLHVLARAPQTGGLEFVFDPFDVLSRTP